MISSRPKINLGIIREKKKNSAIKAELDLGSFFKRLLELQFCRKGLLVGENPFLLDDKVKEPMSSC